MARLRNGNISGVLRTFTTQQSLNDYVWNICDILRRSNCAGALQYIPELTWILFLRIFDEKEAAEAEHAEAVGASFRPSIESPYRWQDWAAPDGWKRKELQAGALGAFFAFVNGELIPYLHGLKDWPNATPRQKVISQIMSGVERTRIDTEYNMLEVLDRVHAISRANIDLTHMFPLSQAYEGLLLKLGEKNNDGGQFFTPRVIIRALVKTVAPRIGKTVYDPGCGTGGMLVESYAYMYAHEPNLTADQLDQLKHRTFYGREKENLIYPIALANLVLHDIDQPNIWHGNTLTGQEIYGGLFESAPAQHHYVFTNPPFGGKEGKPAQTQFAYKTSATQVLFLQHVIDSLATGGTCGIVLDEGVLFRTNETAFVQTKRKLLNDCNLWCIVSLPSGVFSAVGAGVKTNLLFFTKGEPTRNIWYYDLSGVKVTKKQPLTDEHFEEFFRLLPERADTEFSWSIDIEQRRADARRQADPLRAQAARPAAQATQLRQQSKELDKRRIEKSKAVTLYEIEAARPEAFPQARQKLQEMRESSQADTNAVAKLHIEAGALEAEARELNAKAQAIEDAVYDLKAVNPHARLDEDTRTPEDLIALIEAKGREVTEALATLRRPS